MSLTLTQNNHCGFQMKGGIVNCLNQRLSLPQSFPQLPTPAHANLGV